MVRPIKRLANVISLTQVFACLLFGCYLDSHLLGQEASDSEDIRERGKDIYVASCADCHGNVGEGVEGAYEKALIGDDSIGQLADLIGRTMPEGSPEDCVAADAEAVAEYIHYAFYSEAAQVRNRPPSIALTRLTAAQMRQHYSDLYANFYGLAKPEQDFGLQAEYFDEDRWSSKNKKFDRIDPVLNFDFGRESPGEGIQAEQFSIRWYGGLIAKKSGRYELIVRSTCSFIFEFGNDDRELINNYVQSGDKTEFRRTIQLTAGRVYPVDIRFRQRKRKTELPPARISLSWVPPGGQEEVIPQAHLTPHRVPAAYSLQADLPADDRSYGYERGIAVSREWEECTTAAALEFSEIAADEIWPSYLRRHRRDPGEPREKLVSFLSELVGTAFRRELAEQEQQAFVKNQLKQEPDDALAIKRVCLVALKSPRFLYPALDVGNTPAEVIRNRLALILFDSLPVDSQINRESEWTEEKLRRFVEQKYDDYRVQAKLREMVFAWFNLEHHGEAIKNSELYPEFDVELRNDLRVTFEAAVDEIIAASDPDFRNFFAAADSFTTPKMGEVYGEEWTPVPAEVANESSGLTFTPDILKTRKSDKHFGLLNHPYLLSSLAYPDSTSPIHRGVFLIRYVLGRTLRPPAEAFTPLSPDLHPNLTTRERVELQTGSEGCQVCHRKINHLGFALEHFDAIGAYRTKERGKPIDTRGRYVQRSGEQVEFDGLGDLASYLAESEDAQRAFVSRVFQHFVKQPPAAYGADTLDRLTSNFRKNACNIRKLLVDVVLVAVQEPGTSAVEPQPSGDST